MAGKTLSEEMKAELDRLALLPDSEIDTSEIPEVVDWSEARRGAFYSDKFVSRDYDVRAIANWTLEKLARQGLSATNLALNKLIYFAVERALVERAILLTPAKIEAWDHGPVFREIYHAFKGDNATIKSRISKFSISERRMIEASEEILNEDQEFLEELIIRYGRLSGSKLRELSHRPGGPWHSVWSRSGRSNPGMEISIRTILTKAPERRQVDG
jgi:uncharacterized phage-associated protein